MESKERLYDIAEQNIYIAFFCVGLILLAWILVLDRKKVKQYFGAYIEARFVDQIDRSGRLNVVTRVLFVSSISLALYKWYNHYFIEGGFGKTGLLLWLLIVGAVVVWYLVKFIFSYLISWIFNVEGLSKEESFYGQLNTVVLSVIVFPVLLIAHFQELVPEIYFVYIVLLVLILSFFVKSRRIFQVSFSRFSIPLYYNILYICTLEILPLVVLIKALVGKM